jgi:hypothetical protein
MKDMLKCARQDLFVKADRNELALLIIVFLVSRHTLSPVSQVPVTLKQLHMAYYKAFRAFSTGSTRKLTGSGW